VRDLLLAVTISVVSAWAYAAAAVRQERLARTHGAGPVALSRRLGWWRAVLLTCAGAGLHVLALRFGPLTLVQPLGALTLVFAVLLAGRRTVAVERRGVLATVLGLVGLLLVTGSTAPTRTLGTGAVLGVGLVTAAVLAGLLGYTVVAAPVRRGLSYALASGITSGVASALTQTVTVLLGTHGWSALVGPAAAGVLLLAPAGLLLSQAAYRDGLGAPLAVVIIANPVAAGAIGVALLGERYTAGLPGIALAAGAAALATYGVTLLAVHPRVEATVAAGG
jgi:hypothetical protein